MSMERVRASDRADFMANRPPGVRVRVVRMPGVELVRREGRIAHVLAARLTYSFVKGDEEWVLHETRLAEDDGQVYLGDTLWAELEREGGYQLLHRSGSF
jgi:hypothetical protein